MESEDWRRPAGAKVKAETAPLNRRKVKIAADTFIFQYNLLFDAHRVQRSCREQRRRTIYQNG